MLPWDDIIQVRSAGVCFYLLKDDRRLFLIDSGFIGGVASLQKAIHRRGWENLPLEGILLTHGHLDHTCNVARIKEIYGAWVAISQEDISHSNGTYHYRGASRVCGFLETIGRKVSDFRPFSIDRKLANDDVIDCWDGLHCVHLPGHTAGHMGFYSPTRRLLFSGDIFASYVYPHWPPAILNTCPDLLAQSRQRVFDLSPKYLLPNHADRSTPATHWERFKALKPINPYG
jgi:glyoxylase-like metal-dependent hydrolase (beta-lactamase superfamily II)